MILQQCYDEADDAINSHTPALLAKPRSSLCSEIAEKYAADSLKLADSIAKQAESSAGWLSAELKLQRLQQRYQSLELDR